MISSMKRLCLFLCLLLGSVRAEEEISHHYLLIAPEEMAELPVERVRGWMEQNLHYPVQVRRIPAWAGQTAQEQFQALELPEQPDVIVTVVMSTTLDEGKHAVILPEARIGFINVPLMLEDSEEEPRLRRLDRQAIRIVGFTLGVPPQPMPFCALAPYRTLEELDRMGRGFSPPAMAQYRARLLHHGIPLSPDADRHLPNVRVNIPAPPAPAED